MRKIIILLLVLLPAHALAVTGNQLKELCNSDNPPEILQCGYYVKGAFQSHLLIQKTEDFKPHFCAPENATVGQVVAIVREYMDATPEKLPESAALLVWESAIKAFPCE